MAEDKKSESKKSKLLRLLSDNPILGDTDGRKFKTISYDDFRSIGFSPHIEYGQKYCDVIYSKQILRRLGYRVFIGAWCMYVIETDSATLL